MQIDLKEVVVRSAAATYLVAHALLVAIHHKEVDFIPYCMLLAASTIVFIVFAKH